MGVREYYEAYHKVKASDYIVREAVILSERYINDRFLPDKAIDLLDEACACASLRSPQLTEYEKLTKESESLAKREEEMESDPQNVDYEQLAQVKSQSLAVRQQLEALEPQVKDIKVTVEDLAKVIELCTGISAAKIQESEYKKSGHLKIFCVQKLSARMMRFPRFVQLFAAIVPESASAAVRLPSSL